MTNWEYCRLVWSIRQVKPTDQQALADYHILQEESAEIGPLYVAAFGTLRFLGSSQERQRITDVDTTLAQLGRAGWELVSHTRTGDNPSTDTYYLKRPIQASAG
jgi:hypothetical protein